MDVKPQRPTRALRVFGDENAVPTAGNQKTLHQRNKSSPALSTMANVGGMKPGSRRTAFGDVSNMVNLSRPSKDDSTISGKGDPKVLDNVIPAQQDKKTSSFLRPAQRPISIAGLKSLMNNVSNASHQPSVKQPLAEIQQPTQHKEILVKPISRKPSVIKSTATFKAITTTNSDTAQSGCPKESTSVGPIAPVHRDLLPRQQSQPLEASHEPQDSLDQQPAKDLIDSETQPQLTKQPTQISSEDIPSLKSDGVYIDEQGKVQSYDYIDPIELADVLPIEDERKANVKEPQDTVEKSTDTVLNAPHLESKPIRKSTLTTVSEPEEYWDDEGEDNYDEEGYVTARSYKSKGDNTTGGATTVLFPKLNLKTKKEIAAAKILIEGSKTREELVEDAWDTTMVAEYGEEIFQYMKDLEIKMLPNAHYMDNQAEIQWSMRAVLMDWIVQVHHRFNLLPETLFLCVNYIDRFLSCKVVSLGKLQLVGATAIFIAAKYEEIDCPSVQEIVYMVDGGYTVDEILKAERFMLSMLQFELGWPGPMSFLRRISKADDYDLETRTLAKYFLEVTIMDERFVGSPPSFVAAGAHCLAMMMLKKGSWTVAHVYYSNYTYAQLFSLVLLIVECCEDARKHHCAVYDKYTDKRYKRASHFAESEMKRGFQIIDVSSHASNNYASLYDERPAWSMK